jgi:hypothetical protein
MAESTGVSAAGTDPLAVVEEPAEAATKAEGDAVRVLIAKSSNRR